MVNPSSVSKVDLVIVGAGPIGLWTALQIKDWMPDLSITMLEKHNSYQRNHQLRINPRSLPFPWSVRENSHSYEAVQFLRNNLNPKTDVVEGVLAAAAEKAKITILRSSPFVDKASLLKQFPQTKIFIGADGAHSLFRKQIFGEELIKEQELQYIAELKYSVQGPAQQVSLTQKVALNAMTGTFNCRYIGSYHAVTNTTPITIRTVIPYESFTSLQEWSFRQPGDLKALEQKDLGVYDFFQKWIEKANDTPIGLGRVTVTKLGCYMSPSVVLHKTFQTEEIEDEKEEVQSSFSGFLAMWQKGNGNKTASQERIFLLCGDAAFGVPFFRSMNNGLLCGQKLAKCVYWYLRIVNEQQNPFWFKPYSASSILRNPLQSYQNYVNLLGEIEISFANVKANAITSYASSLGAVHQAYNNASSTEENSYENESNEPNPEKMICAVQ
jgi:hypothetical protein